MKNLNLSYVLFGVFLLTVVSVLFFGREDSKQTNIEVLSFPNPEEVKEEVKEEPLETAPEAAPPVEITPLEESPEDEFEDEVEGL